VRQSHIYIYIISKTRDCLALLFSYLKKEIKMSTNTSGYFLKLKHADRRRNYASILFFLVQKA
jgi:hypothetical protein